MTLFVYFTIFLLFYIDVLPSSPLSLSVVHTLFISHYFILLLAIEFQEGTRSSETESAVV